MALKVRVANPEVRKNVEARNGYCPCAIFETPDTKCMCKEFRDQKTPGACHCGLYEKYEA